MRQPQPKAIHLKDYSPPEFRIDSVDLDVDLRDDHARVRAKLQVRRNGGPGPLVLDGEELQLISVSLDGTQPQYEVAAQKLTLRDVPDAFTLETVSRIVPQKNTQLEGLYATKNGFVTQCEAEGFRRITWFIDRPDVMARYTTTIHADRKRYPVLLSNGNLMATGEEPGGRHWARFADPFPKPSYLFAMVAADLEVLEDAYQGKKLLVYVEPGKLDQAGWAMDCLKRAIQWDEKRFGLRLDLDQYKIVAVGDFNSGAMKHPVRPQAYMEIRNFYTMTVYEKGAEVVRMQHSLLGEDKFKAGMRLYFKRHDGQAVTCDDFVQAMQDASGIDLSQFKLWYDVAGTPVLDCRGTYENGSFTLAVKQSMNPPFHIPFAVKIGDEEQVLSIRRPEEEFIFRNLKSKPVPSLLRRFSAPVILNYPFTDEELVHLMGRDDDAFNRWEAGQRLAASIILGRKGAPSRAFLDASRSILSDRDPAFAAEALTLPPEAFLAEQMQVVDPDLLHSCRNELRLALAQGLKAELLSKYENLRVAGAYSPDAVSAGKRALRNLCLGFLSELGMSGLAYGQLQQADNMTDAIAALASLANLDCPERQPALDAFYEKWKHEPLVVDKWLAVQSTSRLPDALPRVKWLLSHPAFDIKLPNKVYALIRGFASNHARFDAADGAGYGFLADQVIALNALNPQVAARMARGFDRWKRFDAARQAKARAQLERIRDAEGLSKDVAEIVTKALAG